jgi:hypothetical protein
LRNKRHFDEFRNVRNRQVPELDSNTVRKSGFSSCWNQMSSRGLQI